MQRIKKCRTSGRSEPLSMLKSLLCGRKVHPRGLDATANLWVFSTVEFSGVVGFEFRNTAYAHDLVPGRQDPKSR